MNEQATKVVGRRVGAFLIDALVLTAINAVIFMALKQDKVAAFNSGDLATGDTTYVNITIGDHQYGIFGSRATLYFLLTALIGIGYYVIWPGLKGVTLGKLATGIKIVKDSDPTQPPGIGRAFARWFLLIADDFPYIIPMLTGFIVALNSKQNKRIGDMVAGTLVVKRDAAVSPAAAQAPPPGIPFQDPPQ
jgi:uncharacterized RDD family membrane protein YckC